MHKHRILLLTLLTAVFIFCVGKGVHAQQVGFEKEFATAGFMEPVWGEKQLEASHALLTVIKNKFNNQGEITSKRWEKYPEKNINYLSYKDPQGRIWKIDPESVNTGGLDGLELVTPPLNTNEDFKLASEILKEIKSKKIVMRGIRSSGHITVDVSHLMRDPNQISELVDLILTIENRWVEIYDFFKPKRYGTIVNRFSVPLAADQQGLLAELALLSPEKRSFARVRSLFLKYDLIEAERRDPDQKNAGRKWKYRAANYGKLFALTNQTPLPVIEFRVPDLDFGAELKEQAQFIRDLVNEPVKDKIFKSIFGNTPLTWEEASEKISKSSIDRKFVNPADAATGFDLIDITKPVGANGEYLSFGFEAEFVNKNRSKDVLDSIEKPNLVKYPFLDSNVSVEESGNVEVRSLGGEIHLFEVLEQMQQIRSVLKEDLRGFHMHIRIPKSVIEMHDEKKLEAWMSLISDSVFAWRLQNRKHFFALKTFSLARRSVEGLSYRGPVRLTKLPNGVWDFEIRGYMTSIEMIAATAQKLATGLLNPQLIQQSYSERHFLTTSQKAITDSFNEYLKLHHSRTLTDLEKKALLELSDTIQGEGKIPLYNLELMNAASDFEKVKIRNATTEFYKEILTVVRHYTENKQDFNEADKQFRWRIKRWAEKINLQKLLESKILMPKDENKPRALKAYPRLEILNIEKKLNSSDKKIRIDAAQSLFKYEDTAGLSLIEKALQHADEEVRTIAGESLANFTSTEALMLIEKLLAESHDQLIRKLAAFALIKQTGPTALMLIKKYFNSADVDIQLSATLALRNQTGLASLEVIQKALLSTNENIRAAAAEALETRTDAASLKIILNYINDQNDFVKESVRTALTKQKGSHILPLIEKYLIQTDLSLQFLAIKTLQNQNGPRVLALAKRYLSHSNPAVQLGAAETIYKQNGPDVLQMIQVHLSHPDEAFRTAAAEALEGEKGPLAIKLIAQAMQDTSPSVHFFATQALYGLTGPGVLNLIQQAYQSKHENVRQNAILSLKNRFEPEAIVILKKAQNDSNKTIRDYARQILDEQRRNIIEKKGSLNTKYQINRCEQLFR